MSFLLDKLCATSIFFNGSSTKVRIYGSLIPWVKGEKNVNDAALGNLGYQEADGFNYLFTGLFILGIWKRHTA